MRKMKEKKRFDLSTRNTKEIVTKKELKALINRKESPTVYCGYEPSGPIHLGHLITILKLLDFQKAGFKVKVLLADLHAFLNRKGDKRYIITQTTKWEKGMKTIGLDQAEFIKGSSFEYSEEYLNDLHEIALKTTINRGLRSMKEIARDIENAKISQIIYPLMQAVDIKHLGVEVALGGMEQRRIHMLARERLPDLGYTPPIAVHTPIITSLKGPGEKMSSSVEGSFIDVLDSPETIKEKIMEAYCPPREVHQNPIVELTNYLLLPQFGEVTIHRKEKYGGDVTVHSVKELNTSFKNGDLHPKDLKENVVRLLDELISPVRELFR